MFCGPCGTLHDGPVNNKCKAAEQNITRRSTRSAKMASGESERPVKCKKETGGKEVSAEDGEDDTGDDDLLEQIRAIERRKRREILRARKEALLEMEVGAGTPLEELSCMANTGARGTVPKLERTQTSTSKEESRGRPRHRHASSSSRSRSRTRSADRRRRSKWSLRRYTNKKEVSKLNCYELIESSCNWFADQSNRTFEDYDGFIAHVRFLASKAKRDRFLDSSHVSYDCAIRRIAEKEGMKAFNGGNPEHSITYYSCESMRNKNSSNLSNEKKSNAYVKDGVKPCFNWNKGTCSREDGQCMYGHWCAKCGSRSHKKYKCQN